MIMMLMMITLFWPAIFMIILTLYQTIQDCFWKQWEKEKMLIAIFPQ